MRTAIATSLIDQLAKMGDGRIDHVVDLHCGGLCGHHVASEQATDRRSAQRPGPAAHWHWIRPSSVRVAIATPTRGINSTIAAAVDAAQRQPGEDREHDASRDIDETVDEHRHVLGVVAEVGDGPRRPNQQAGQPLWAATRNLAGRGRLARSSDCMLHPSPRPAQHAEVDGAHPGEFAQGQRGTNPITREL